MEDDIAQFCDAVTLTFQDKEELRDNTTGKAEDNDFTFNRWLEERGAKYTIRIPANDCLLRDIAELLTRPVGRPAHKPVVWYRGFLYQAASWTRARFSAMLRRIALLSLPAN